MDTGRQVQQLLWASGWTRLGWPSSCGGLDGGPLLRAGVYEALTLHGVTLPETFPTIETLGNTMVRFAPDLADRLLPAAIRGETIWCQGYSEPESGSDLGGLRTTLKEVDDKLVLNGQKTWTSLGPVSDFIVTLARSEAGSRGFRGLSMLMVDLRSPGVVLTPITAATGEDEFAEVTFNDVVVPRTAVIGIPGQGWDVAMFSLQWERGMYAWQRQGWMHTVLTDLLDTPELQQLQSPETADIYTGLTGLRLSARNTLRLLAEGGTPGPLTSVDKLMLSAVERQLFDLARDVLSPQLEFSDDPRAAYWRGHFQYSRVASVFGGTAQIQQNIIAERLLGLPREFRNG